MRNQIMLITCKKEVHTVAMNGSSKGNMAVIFGTQSFLARKLPGFKGRLLTT